jgi:hypothetical protein
MVHAITVAQHETSCLALESGKPTSAHMPNNPSDYRAQKRAVLSVVMAAAALAFCAGLAFGAVRLVQWLF